MSHRPTTGNGGTTQHAWRTVIRIARQWQLMRDEHIATQGQVPNNAWVDEFTTLLNEHAGMLERTGTVTAGAHEIPWEALGQLCMSVHHTREAQLVSSTAARAVAEHRK